MGEDRRAELPLSYRLIAPSDVDAVWSFGLRSEFGNVHTVSSRSNVRWFATAYDKSVEWKKNRMYILMLELEEERERNARLPIELMCVGESEKTRQSRFDQCSV